MSSSFYRIFKHKVIYPSPMTRREWLSVPAWIRNYLFFVSGVDDIRLLKGLHQLTADSINCGYHDSVFIRKAREWMTANGYDEWNRINFAGSEDAIRYFKDSRNIGSRTRLQSISRTQFMLCAGVHQFRKDFSMRMLYMRPGYIFIRQQGAKTKRKDHVVHENEIRLKSDFLYWIERNSAKTGCFEIPHAPFGFNSWMHISPRDRKTCAALGLISEDDLKLTPREVVNGDFPETSCYYISPASREKWGLPLAREEDANDPERLQIVEEKARWGIPSGPWPE